MSRSQVIIVGGGFAGVWAALGAARELHERGAAHQTEVRLVSPTAALGVRPRYYEPVLDKVQVPLAAILDPVGVRHRLALVEHVDSNARRLTLAGPQPGSLRYDQLVLASGSRLEMPPATFGAPLHSVDAYEDALALQASVTALARAGNGLRATVVGAGFTGIETAAELVGSLRAAARASGRDADEVEVTLVDAGPLIAPDFGPTARAAISQALGDLGVTTRTHATVRSIGHDSIALADGQRIASDLTVWATGPTPSPLARDVPAERDPLGRLLVDETLATGVDGIWAAGDLACAPTDRRHQSAMSCQHAMPQGKRAGANAVAVVCGASARPYAQHLYLTCLDLGGWGGLLTPGWQRDDILASGRPAKEFKRYINRSVIYPPATGRAKDLLTFGRPDMSSALSARAQAVALRLHAVRGALIKRAVDGPDAYARRALRESWTATLPSVRT